MTTVFRASSDRKVAPYGRKQGKSPNGMKPLKNSFGLPAGKDFSCKVRLNGVSVIVTLVSWRNFSLMCANCCCIIGMCISRTSSLG